MEHVEIFLLLPVYVEAGDQPGYLKRLELLGNKEYHEYSLGIWLRFYGNMVKE